MKYSLSTKHLELSDLDSQLLEEKLERLEKLVRTPFTTDVVLRHDQHHRKGKVITCRISIEHGDKVFHAMRSAATVQDALDEVISRLRKELERSNDNKHAFRGRWWRFGRD